MMSRMRAATGSASTTSSMADQRFALRRATSRQRAGLGLAHSTERQRAERGKAAGGEARTVQKAATIKIAVAWTGRSVTSVPRRAFDRLGWAWGGGLEYAFASRWSVKAEYLWLGLNHSVGVCAAAAPGFIASGGTL
jgi:opacity protein-like surface antigen